LQIFSVTEFAQVPIIQVLTGLIYVEEKRFPHYREDGLSIREVKMLLGMEKQM